MLNAICCYTGMQAIFGNEELSGSDEVDSNVLHIPVDMPRQTAEGDCQLCNVSWFLWVLLDICRTDCSPC